MKVLKETLRVAKKQVGILEWPYREQSFGPPLAHRLNPDELAGLFQKAGYRKWKKWIFLIRTCTFWKCNQALIKVDVPPEQVARPFIYRRTIQTGFLKQRP